MAVGYSIRDGILTMDLSGTYAPADVVRAFLDAMDDPVCPQPVALLIDVSRSASLATRPSDQIRMVAEFIGPYADRIGGRCAVVAPSDVLFGLSQMACARSRGVGIDAQAFRSEAEARHWLGHGSARRT